MALFPRINLTERVQEYQQHIRHNKESLVPYEIVSMIHYYVDAKDPKAHLFNIRMVITEPNPKGQMLSLPVWNPGSYLIRDYARHIVMLEAYTEMNGKEKKIQVHKINSNTWQCEAVKGPLTLAYTVYAWDYSIRGARIDETQAFFNGCALFLAVVGQETALCKVKILPPACKAAEKWQVATTLARDGAPLWGYGDYTANNYEELIDHPVLMGSLEILEFSVCGTPHALAVSGKQDGDLPRLIADISKICETHIKLFGEKPPFDQYLFQLSVFNDAYGGLEHRSSCTLQSARDNLPQKEDASLSRGYISLLGLFSHEYFHAWNVKRIKPLCFMPYDLNHKSYTQQLWAFEGFTSYYDDLACVRAKVMTDEQYFDYLSQTLTKVLRCPGRKVQTLTESSFDAWIKFYQPNENSLNATVSYYLKGTLVALALDLALRLQTQNKASLDTVMQQLWREYGVPLQGVPEGKIAEIIKQQGGAALAPLVHQALYTTEDLPLKDLFTEFGLTLNVRQALNDNDSGGTLKDTPVKRGYFGWSILRNHSRIYVSQVLAGGPALQAGISANDEIVAIDGVRTDADTWDKITLRLQAEQTVKLHVFKLDILQEISLTLQPLPYDTAEITVSAHLSVQQKENLSQWIFKNYP